MDVSKKRGSEDLKGIDHSRTWKLTRCDTWDRYCRWDLNHRSWKHYRKTQYKTITEFE